MSAGEIKSTGGARYVTSNGRVDYRHLDSLRRLIDSLVAIDFVIHNL